MTDNTPTHETTPASDDALVARLRYTEEHGLFVAALADMVASYGEAADAIEALHAREAAAKADAEGLAEALRSIAHMNRDTPFQGVRCIDIARAALANLATYRENRNVQPC